MLKIQYVLCECLRAFTFNTVYKQKIVLISITPKLNMATKERGRKEAISNGNQ